MYYPYLCARWRSKGASGSRCPGAKALGKYQHFIQPFKNAKFKPNYASKLRIFGKQL